jgi:uncharacterized protein (AIM24 family)
MKKDGGGIFGKLFEAGKRVVTGESFFITIFANEGGQRRDVGFGAPYPGHVVPVELGDFGGRLLCQKDSFLCAASGIEVDIAFNKRLGAGFFGGEGFILQRLSSPSGQGQAFLHAGGSVVKRTLGPGEKLRVDTGCLVAFEEGVDYSIEFVKGIKNKLFGGEGLFYAAMQTLPFSRLARARDGLDADAAVQPPRGPDLRGGAAAKASTVRVSASVSASRVNAPAGVVSRAVVAPRSMVTGMGLLPEPPKRPGRVWVPVGLVASS